MAALARTHAHLDADAQQLLDSVEGLLLTAQVSEQRHGQDRLLLRLHAARLVRPRPYVHPPPPPQPRLQVEAAQSLSRLAELLKRNALLSDYAGRAAASDAETAAAQREQGLAELARRAHALLGRVNEQNGLVLLQVGEESVAEADAAGQLGDPAGLLQRLYALAD